MALNVENNSAVVQDNPDGLGESQTETDFVSTPILGLQTDSSSSAVNSSSWQSDSDVRSCFDQIDGGNAGTESNVYAGLV
jgi:hypothetical protein